MFISQMYEDENGEVGFGHFYNGGEIEWFYLLKSIKELQLVIVYLLTG
jgi:hypothetical protein